jgi:competence transcription factor ComK
MEMIDSKLITSKTIFITSYFINGYEYSLVNEGYEKIHVKKSPDEIVNLSFIHNGNTLKGATEAARTELKRRYKQVPVVLPPGKSIALIKCKSTDPHGCVWLVESQIIHIEPYQDDHTLVIMKDGSILIVNMKPHELQQNKEKALYLRVTFLDRSSFDDSTYPANLNHHLKSEIRSFIIQPNKAKKKKPFSVK